MTFSATILNSGSRDKRLVARKPLRPLAKTAVRSFVVTQEIADLLDGKIEGAGFPHFAADALVARYIAGYLVGVSLIGTSSPLVDLERLKDEDEIWMLCPRLPKPGWRIFGRFLAQNKFVGLRAYDRNDLSPVSAYHDAAVATEADWNDIVRMAPLRASNIDAYLTGVWRDVDQP